MSLPSCGERFFTTVCDLAELIHEIISFWYERGYNVVNPIVVSLASGYISSLDKTYLIETFITHSNVHWDKVSGRDETFFKDNAGSLFPDLPFDQVNAFKILFETADNDGKFLIGDEDRCAIWDFFDSLIRISINYVHEKREPRTKDNKHVYKVKIFPEINVAERATKWAVSLTWPR